jgi:hypothetical protein
MKQAFSLIALFTGGCLSMLPTQSDELNRANATARRNQAAENAFIECNSVAQCDKAFRLTKIYVQQHASMKIQISDDTIVQTYNPTSLFETGIAARKIPGKGESSRIEITVVCNDSSFDRGANCPNRQAQIYEGFRPFVSSKLD